MELSIELKGHKPVRKENSAYNLTALIAGNIPVQNTYIVFPLIYFHTVIPTMKCVD